MDGKSSFKSLLAVELEFSMGTHQSNASHFLTEMSYKMTNYLFDNNCIVWLRAEISPAQEKQTLFLSRLSSFWFCTKIIVGALKERRAGICGGCEKRDDTTDAGGSFEGLWLQLAMLRSRKVGPASVVAVNGGWWHWLTFLRLNAIQNWILLWVARLASLELFQNTSCLIPVSCIGWSLSWSCFCGSHSEIDLWSNSLVKESCWGLCVVCWPGVPVVPMTTYTVCTVHVQYKYKVLVVLYRTVTAKEINSTVRVLLVQ